VHPPSLRAHIRGAGVPLVLAWHSCAVSKAVQESGFADQFVEQASSVDELCRSVKFRNLALLQHYDSIRVQNGVDTVRYRDDGTIVEDATPQSGLQHGICFDVNSCGCFVENQDVAGCQECPG
jgi:hypothetical protein